MKFAAALLACTAAAVSNTRVKYMHFIAEHNRSFLTTEEFEARHALFAETDAFVEEHNASNASFTVAHNFFSDLTEDEKANTRGRVATANKIKNIVELDETSTPSSVDWRDAGAVNKIQDQGQCGSCWAFGAVAALEGAHFNATGTLLKFAEQQLVDCAGFRYGNYGCNGGLQENAYDYYESHDAIEESNYPYTARDGSCKYDSLKHTAVEVSKYTNVKAKSSSQTLAALAQQVLTVSIEADKRVFQQYSSGVFDSSQCGTNLDHAVSLVGYGSENGQNYYILRNSWGTSWGEKGYMRIANDGDGAGVCGVQKEPLYPAAN